MVMENNSNKRTWEGDDTVLFFIQLRQRRRSPRSRFPVHQLSKTKKGVGIRGHCMQRFQESVGRDMFLDALIILAVWLPRSLPGCKMMLAFHGPLASQ